MKIVFSKDKLACNVCDKLYKGETRLTSNNSNLRSETVIINCNLKLFPDRTDNYKSQNIRSF